MGESTVPLDVYFHPELIDASVFLAPGAVVVGQVVVQARASLWYYCVVRGDREKIHIGAGSNVQDHCVLHADPGFPCVIGANVTIGHRAVIHGTFVGDGSLVGMGATVMNGSVIGPGSVVAAGALIPQGKTFPPGVLIAGVPGKVMRPLTPDEQLEIPQSAIRYQEAAIAYKAAYRREED